MTWSQRCALCTLTVIKCLTLFLLILSYDVCANNQKIYAIFPKNIVHHAISLNQMNTFWPAHPAIWNHSNTYHYDCIGYVKSIFTHFKRSNTFRLLAKCHISFSFINVSISNRRGFACNFAWNLHKWLHLTWNRSSDKRAD